MATTTADRTRVATAVGALLVAGMLVTDAAVAADRRVAVVGAVVAGAAALVLLVVAVTWRAVTLGWGVAALLGAFAASLPGREVPDVRAVVWAGALVLVVELAGWSDELSVAAPANADERSDAGRHAATLVVLAAAVSAPVLLAGRIVPGHGEIVMLAGALAAAGAIGLVATASRHEQLAAQRDDDPD